MVKHQIISNLFNICNFCLPCAVDSVMQGPSGAQAAQENFITEDNDMAAETFIIDLTNQ